MAAPGVRSQDGRKKGKKSLLFYLAGPGVRGQDERDNERDKWKQTFFPGIKRRRLAAKGQPGEARFGPELDIHHEVCLGEEWERKTKKKHI